MVTTLNNTNHDDWCYIRSVSTGNVVSANRGLVNGEEDALRSQVYLYAPKQIDEELWRWDGQYIRNKATGLVLDIRKGRLRLIEDTEICLYNPKPTEEAHNQLWGVRDDVVDALGRRQEGCVVYSVCNAEWVLDVQSMVDGGKLVLFPYQSIDNDSQRWSFVPESAINSPMMSAAATNVSELFSSSSSSSGSSPSSPIYDLSSPPPGAEFANGLSPAKRGSQSSVTMLSTEAYKECHQMVYLERNPHLSDKAIAMAAAYQSLQNWKIDRTTLQELPEPQEVHTQLQSMAHSEATNIFNECDQLSNHKETALGLASRLVIQLYEQQPSSP